MQCFYATRGGCNEPVEWEFEVTAGNAGHLPTISHMCNEHAGIAFWAEREGFVTLERADQLIAE